MEAVFSKELRDYRRNRLVIMTMAFLPLVSRIVPTSGGPSWGTLDVLVDGKQVGSLETNGTVEVPLEP